LRSLFLFFIFLVHAHSTAAFLFQCSFSSSFFSLTWCPLLSIGRRKVDVGHSIYLFLLSFLFLLSLFSSLLFSFLFYASFAQTERAKERDAELYFALLFLSSPFSLHPSSPLPSEELMKEKMGRPTPFFSPFLFPFFFPPLPPFPLILFRPAALPRDKNGRGCKKRIPSLPSPFLSLPSYLPASLPWS